MTARSSSPRPERRTGFTLLEMLAVILIIAILVAVAFPAYQAVMINARTTTVRSEMAALGSAIADFKSKFGTEPPSRISFSPAAGGGLQPATKAILRQMFPQISFDATLNASLEQAGLVTLTPPGSGPVATGEVLIGNEALVFFLGGVRRNTGATAATLTDELIGFSKNPANPFAQPGAGTSNRIGPFFEFRSDRLARNPDDGADGSDPWDDSGVVEQLVFSDALSKKPYIYASTAETGKYRDGATPAFSDFPDRGDGTLFMAYRRPDATATLADNPYWNPDSYQLISAGADGLYGDGGVYDPSGKVPLDPVPLGAATPGVEDDNLANFADGPLGG